MSFEDLKKSRKSMFDKLVTEAEKVNTNSGGGKDDRYWTPTVDKSGNGYAVIRFLPSKNGEELPWAKYYDHGFKGPTGRWYIEKSLSSIGKDDPLGELNSYLWNTGNEEDKETARSRKRRLHYVSNVIVISDPGAPENEGKVFLYKYGKKIFTKITDVMQPEFEDETPINPFDFWEGANFKLKIRQVEGYRNYDKSEFASPSELFDGDEDKLKVVYESLNDLSEFSDPKNYKTYEELSRKLHDVLGDEILKIKNGGMAVHAEEAPVIEEKSSDIDPDDDLDYSMKSDEKKDSDSEDDDEMMSFFAKLASE